MPSGIYIGNKGRKAWNKGMIGFMKGKVVSEETKKKMSDSQKGIKRPYCCGENHWEWKGKNVGYRALHHWVIRKLGKAIICEHCGKVKTTPKSIQWANKSHKYKRDLNDWISLCVKCHKHYDGYGVEV